MKTIDFRDPQINLYVRDVERSVAFYRDNFGFTETFRTPEHGAPVHVELKSGSFVLGIAALEAARATHGVAAELGPPRAELVLWTNGVDEAFARLIEKGISAISEPHDFGASLRGAWVADPDGTPVQIVERRR